jgi:predicted transcriptional regulator
MIKTIQLQWSPFVTEETVPQVEASAALLRMTTDIVAAYVGRNVVPTAEIASVIGAVHAALASVGQVPEEAEPLKPAVSIKKSITPEYLICLEDGKKLKMLKRHLRSTYGMSPEDYRAKWGLPADYPMVAPRYAEARSEFAKKIGLGRKTLPEPPKKTGRKAKAA